MTRLKAHAARLVILLASATILSACTYFHTEETIIPRPELLTAEEAGGGERLSIKTGDTRGATACGPGGTTHYPSLRETPYAVQYVSGGRRIILGAWDYLDGSFDFGPPKIDEEARSDYCRLGRAYWGDDADSQSTDWRVTPLDFGEGIAAFQAIEWHGKGLAPPPEPVVEEGGWVYAVARAYGIVDDTYIMVRIDLENTSVEPPSEEELRALWDAQVAKVRYFKAIERSEEVLTPQSGQSGK